MFAKYLVEFLGTLLLVYTIFATGNWLFIGLALAVAVLIGGKVSGGAYNPAVAFALYHAGKLPLNDLGPYVFMEVLGGLAGYQIYTYLK
jgi:aquaporin Z